MNKLNGKITANATLRGAMTRGAGGGTYVEANPEGEATDTLEKLMVEDTIYNVRNVPDASSAHNGDVLTKIASGVAWLPPTKELPTYTSGDNGKVLKIVNGSPTWDYLVKYSTNEHVVGVWVDGVTPVYEKTIFNNNLQSISYQAVEIGAIPDGMNLLIGVDCIFRPAPGGWAGQAGISSVSSWNISFHIADSIVGYGNGASSFVGGLAICTIRYTKVGE